MNAVFEPVAKQSLSDQLALRIREMIRGGRYAEGDRLPAIMEMARRFGVGHPTIREALKKLETMGIVEIRHGSGVYVRRCDDLFVVAAPEYTGTATRAMLLEILRARLALELEAASGAARHATPDQVAEMGRVLARGAENARRDDAGYDDSVRFHELVAAASGNRVVTQLLTALRGLCAREQRAVFAAHDARDRNHREHLHILEAIDHRDETVAVARMRAHLQGIEAAVRRWDPEPNRPATVEHAG